MHLANQTASTENNGFSSFSSVRNFRELGRNFCQAGKKTLDGWMAGWLNG
jgi:hypothetical protein